MVQKKKRKKNRNLFYKNSHCSAFTLYSLDRLLPNEAQAVYFHLHEPRTSQTKAFVLRLGVIPPALQSPPETIIEAK